MASVNEDIKVPTSLSNDTEGSTENDTASSSVVPKPDSNSFNDATPAHFRKDSRFWLILLALCVSCFLSALDLTAVSTILPTLSQDFDSPNYAWVGSSYALTSTAFIPWFGGLAKIFGRKFTMLLSLGAFTVGSAVVGSASSMNIVIAGRAIQGVGGGGILTMTEIVIVDIVPLAERGAYFGILGSVWAISSAIGPPIGGAFANSNQWRRLFYMNLPIAAVAAVLVAVFMNVKVPVTTWREKAEQMDYMNFVFVAAMTCVILALTWGGSTYSWSSVPVLVPLLLGIIGLGVYLYLEKVWVRYPTVPFAILRHRTSLIGYTTNTIHGITVMAVVYFLPVYFQSIKGTTALQSGIDLFSISFTIAPFAIITGAFVTITGNYKIPNLVAWSLTMLGLGLLTLLSVTSGEAAWVSFPIILGIGMGINYAAINYPVLAPLAPEEQPSAMAFHALTRSFGQVLGITIGSTVLQNQLSKKLPESFISQFGGTSNVAYAAIPLIKNLAEPLRTEVRTAFAASLRVIWQVVLGLAGVALFISIFMEQIELAKEVDQDWGLHEKVVKNDQEAQVEQQEKLE